MKVQHSGTATPPSDNQIEKRIKTVLKWNSDMNAGDIEVSVRSGVVIDKEDFGKRTDVYVQRPGA